MARGYRAGHPCEDFLSSPGASAARKDLRCRHRPSLDPPRKSSPQRSGGTTPNICICKVPSRRPDPCETWKTRHVSSRVVSLRVRTYTHIQLICPTAYMSYSLHTHTPRGNDLMKPPLLLRSRAHTLDTHRDRDLGTRIFTWREARYRDARMPPSSPFPLLVESAIDGHGIRRWIAGHRCHQLPSGSASSGSASRRRQRAVQVSPRPAAQKPIARSTSATCVDAARCCRRSLMLA